MAAIDLADPQLVLSQFADNHLYTNTLMMLHRYDPVTVLMSDTAADSALYRLIHSEVRTPSFPLCARTFSLEELHNLTLHFPYLSHTHSANWRNCTRSSVASSTSQPASTRLSASA